MPIDGDEEVLSTMLDDVHSALHERLSSAKENAHSQAEIDYIEQDLFWQDEIEGPLHSVRFSHRKMLASGEWQNLVGEFTYH